MLAELKTGNVVVGLKQLRKVLRDNTAKAVFLAKDADARLVEPIARQCQENGVALVWVDTMGELGTACGIDVGAAAAASLQ